MRGERLSPGPIDLTWCLTDASTPFEEAGCDPSTTIAAIVDPEGGLAIDSPIHRVITVGDTAYDCAARTQACSIFGHRPDNPLDTGLAAPLGFATGLPPVDAAAPPGG
ncbi:hypothetical protein ACE2AJ_16780 [Aquihabitans daechungensis]|uniref:hypothetical protein n=1 Tax=Aquihabitans daechungensis TaxID=1052257 RepID=UPI003BA2DC44